MTPADRIFHGVTTLTCALLDSTAIACNNQLTAIQDLCQATHQWSQPTPSLSKVLQVTTPHPTHTQKRSVLCPMRRLETIQPHALLPRMVIQMPNAAPSSPRLPSTKEKYEPVTRSTRSKVPNTEDPTPSRVYNITDFRPIAWLMRSQTTAMANVINPDQVAKQQYPAQFLQILAMPALDKNSGQILQYRQLRKHPKFAHI